MSAISDINAFLLNLRTAGSLSPSMHDQSPSGVSNKRQRVIEEFQSGDTSSYLPFSISSRTSVDLNQRPINAPHMVNLRATAPMGEAETRTNILHVYLGSGISEEGLILHLIADDWDGSGNWVDTSSNAYSFAPGGNSVPTKVTAGLGGSSGVSFVGNSSYFEIETPEDGIGDLNDKVIYVVFTATEQAGVTPDAPTVTANSNAISNISGAGDFEVFAARNKGGSISIKTLSAYDTPVSLETGTPLAGSDFIFVADDVTTSNLTNKKMAEVVIYAAAHNDATMLATLNSLYAKYALQTT